MARPRALGRLDRELMVDLVKQGIAVADVARQYRVSPRTLYRLAHEAGAIVTVRAAPMDPSVAFLIYQNFEAGLPIGDICDKYQVSRSAAYRAIAAHLPPKPKKQKENPADVIHVEQPAVPGPRRHTSVRRPRR